MSDHRKYHGMYFILGFILAAMLVMLLGCKPGETTGGIGECYGCPPPPPQCCAAMLPECEACKEGCSIDEWKKKTCGEADVIGWDDEENSWMCGIVIID